MSGANWVAFLKYMINDSVKWKGECLKCTSLKLQRESNPTKWEWKGDRQVSMTLPSIHGTLVCLIHVALGYELHETGLEQLCT